MFKVDAVGTLNGNATLFLRSDKQELAVAINVANMVKLVNLGVPSRHIHQKTARQIKQPNRAA